MFNDGFYTDAEIKHIDLCNRMCAIIRAWNGSGSIAMRDMWDGHIVAMQRKIDDCLTIVANEQDDGEIRRIV